MVGFMLLSACDGQRKVSHTDTIIDDYGRTVVLNRNATRVVSISPAITEIIYALGQSHRLVGRTDFCHYPPAADTLTSIGGISNLNIEAILALQPDLIIAASMMPQRSVEQLEKMGIPVVCIIEKKHFEDLYVNIQKIGQVLCCESAADSLNTLLQQNIKNAILNPEDNQESQQRHQNNIAFSSNPTPPTVYYVVGFGPTGNFTAGGNTFIDDIICLAGGRNLAHDITGWSFSLESLIQNDPDYIVLRREDSITFCNTQPYSRLSAVQQGRIIGIESGTIDIQVPRNIDAVRYLRNRIKSLSESSKKEKK